MHLWWQYIHWWTLNVHLIDIHGQWVIPLGIYCNLLWSLLKPLRTTYSVCAHCSSQWISRGAYDPVRQKCTIITVCWFHMSSTAASWPLSSFKKKHFCLLLDADLFFPAGSAFMLYLSLAPRYDCPHKCHWLKRASIFWVSPAGVGLKGGKLWTCCIAQRKTFLNDHMALW